MRWLLFILTISALVLNCNQPHPEKSKGGDSMNAITITSNSFKHNDMIPSKYTCDDKNISPHLQWSDVPEGTKSFSLICDDPDAPVGNWVHWIVYNIPAAVTTLRENCGTINGAKFGTNDFRKLRYGGPCPPSGIHRYFFKIYALDTIIDADEGLSKTELLNKMEGHILGIGELMGKYTRKR